MRVPQRCHLLQQVTDILRSEIRRGAWRGSLPSERTLAADLQVSRPTVRAALKALQREGLIRIVHGKPTRIVRSRLVTGPSHGVMTLLTSVPTDVISGPEHVLIGQLQRNLQDAGCSLKIRSDLRLKRNLPPSVIEKWFCQEPQGVWILHQVNSNLHRYFRQRGIKTLVLGSTPPDSGLPAFDLNYRAISRHAVGEFLRRGHRRIGLIIPDTGLIGDIESETGFREAFQSPFHLDAHATVFKHDQTVAKLCAVLEGMFASKPPPTALLVSHPEDVLTVMTYCMRRNIRIPGDLSLISRGYAPFLDHALPCPAFYRGNWSRYVRRFSRAAVQLLQTGALPTVVNLFNPEFLANATLRELDPPGSKDA